MKYLKILLIFLLLPLAAEAKPCKKITKALLDLYPEHTKEIMLTRFENASDKHKFLRSFIPYYSQEIAQSSAEMPAMQKASKTTGHIVGDAHVENFGYLVGNDGKSILALNDFDDVAQGPLVLDVMRLSQSGSYMDKNLDQAKLIKSYLEGLKNSPYKYSDFVNKLGAKSLEGGHLSKAETKVVGNAKVFAVKQSPSFATTEAQIKTFHDILKKKHGKNYKLLDSYRTMKESGGSAYGKRYHLLVEVDGKEGFIELKEVMDTGVVPKLQSKKVSNKERIISSRDVFLGANYSEMIDVVEVEEKQFQLRHKIAGNKSLDFSKIKSKDYGGLIQDEFYLLGQLHRKSLNADPNKIASYTKDINSITDKEWQLTTDFMRKKIRKAFDAANE